MFKFWSRPFPLSIFAFFLFLTQSSFSFAQDFLIKFKDNSTQERAKTLNSINKMMSNHGREELKFHQFKLINWTYVELKNKSDSEELLAILKNDPRVEYVQPNYKIKLFENYQIHDPILKNFVSANTDNFAEPKDNPALLKLPRINVGADPLLSKQWGMKDIGVTDAWKTTMGDENFIVAVLDTGVDYNHEDLNSNIWRNPGETGLDEFGKDKASNGKDDDNNGYVDDVIGWDFVTNDNLPFDLTTSLWKIISGQGQPGHGTHCAGNVAARGNNSLGIAGVAPKVKIMPLRFLSEKGQGTTASAIKAIEYALMNGAKVLSNSWGSEGEDAKEGEANKALREVIQKAQDLNTLFVAAAGNGRLVGKEVKGYDNDTDAKPGYPASYDHDTILSVAAIDSSNNLGAFSNWGKNSVDIGAPGVKVFSTMVGNQYSDVVLKILSMEVFWDGTSMATPHVAGAAALYWSLHPELSYSDVKDAILSSAVPVPALSSKVVSDGKLNVKNLINNY